MMKLLKVILCLLIPGLFICGSGKNAEVKTKSEVISLTGFTALSGKHCESSAMMNALRHQGLSLSESMINGLSSSMSFIIIDGELPFLGCRVASLKENFQEATQIPIIEVKPDNSQAAYNLVKAKLKENIPVILQVNMRYLPYLYGGKFGNKYTSFGGHFVTLIKLDEKAGYAWVTDTHYEKPQKIKIAHLMKARASKGNYFAPENTFYYFQIDEKIAVDYRASLKVSLKNLIVEYEKPNGVLERLKSFSEDLWQIEERVNNHFVLKPMFEFFYGSIETNGTGGSGFRNFYRDYLIETGRLINSEKLSRTAEFVDDAAKSWLEVAEEFRKIADVIGSYQNDQDKRRQLYENASKKFKELYVAEEIMLQKLKELSYMINYN